MPNRIIKESICSNEQIDQLPAFDETFFYRLIVNADDYGRMDARPSILRSRLFPLKAIRDDQILKTLHNLSSKELVTLYTVGGKPFVRLNGWERNQTIRAKRSKYPSPEEADQTEAIEASLASDSVIAHEIICKQMQADECTCSRNPIQSESEYESNANARSTRTAARNTRPTLEEVQAYCEERGGKVDAQRWFDYYSANGWRVGKVSMTDWRAAVRTWERNGYSNSGGGGASTPAAKPVRQLRDHAYTQREYEDSHELPQWMQEKLRELNGGK